MFDMYSTCCFGMEEFERKNEFEDLTIMLNLLEIKLILKKITRKH